MDINKLRVFLSVYKRRSFSKASEDLYLSQPTVSDHIKSLEEELNCKLFDRIGRSIIPTKEAEVLFDRAQEIVERTDSLKELIAYSNSDVSGELVIGASTIPGTYILPSIMVSFSKKYPSLQFQTIISDSKGISERVIRHELLLGIVGTKLINSMLNYTPFVEDELIVAISPPLVEKREMTLRELLKLPIVLREYGSGTRRETERILELKGLSLEMFKIAGIFGSTEAVKEAVKAGMGFSILSRVAVEDDLNHGKLVEVRLTDVKMKRKFYIVTHKKRTIPRTYGVFIDYLKSLKRIGLVNPEK